MDLTGATSATSASYQNEASSSSAALAADSTPAKAPSIPKGYGKILRDEAGNVIGVELAEDEGDDQDGADNEENGDVDMEMLEPQVPQKILGKWVTELGGGDKSIAGGSVVQGECLRTLFNPVLSSLSLYSLFSILRSLLCSSYGRVRHHPCCDGSVSLARS